MSSKALIAMSGGVDSSVAAYLTKQAGYETSGVTMRLYECNTDISADAPVSYAQNDVEDAQCIAKILNIPFYVLDFKEFFKEKVIDRFIQEYEKGATPNPCINCNKYIKFGLMYDFAYDMEQDFMVTGHYARIDFDTGSGRYLLKRASDEKKDQSYVLYSLSQKQLSKTLFPLGSINKTETREIAETQGFVNYRKRESQYICFVTDGDYSKFIRENTGREYPVGNFIYKDGTVLGKHKGIICYTIGQRKGLGLALPHPVYVCEKDLTANTVILGENKDLFTRNFKVKDMNWIACEQPTADMRAEVKIRYSHRANPARILPLGEGHIQVEFEEPQRAITKGQAAVLYDGDTVIGGGTIL